MGDGFDDGLLARLDVFCPVVLDMCMRCEYE